jgi:tRNA pseudouridine32 synthase/23S rRNA pseudouridine746 synthase
MSPINVAPPQQLSRARNNWDARVLFIDGEALVIDKPAGLAVHRGPKTRASLEDHLRDLRFGFARPPAPVHRLDRDTSGCLLLARNPKAQSRFQRAFEEGRVIKTYVAIVEGVPQAEEGTIEMALGKVSSREAGWRIVHDPGGKAAASRWRLLATRDGRSAILFAPSTGRTHQLRVHAASGLGLPIVGDPVYGDGRGPMLLHALTLRLAREGRKDVEAEAPLPPSFAYAGFGDVGA